MPERTNREHSMHSLSAGVTQSWFVAKAAVALVPIVIFGAADVIGWFLRRTIWRRKTMVPVEPRQQRGVQCRRDREGRQRAGYHRRSWAPSPLSTIIGSGNQPSG